MLNKSDVKKLYIKNIKEGKVKTIKLHGSSMLPTFASEELLKITTKFKIKVGDVVVADAKEYDIFVVHRVVEINKEKKQVCLLGDNEELNNKKWFNFDDILAKVVSNNTKKIDTKKINIVLDLPFGKPKYFNAQSYGVYQALIGENQSTYYFDYNIDFNLNIYGKKRVEEFKKSNGEISKIKNFITYLNLCREITKQKYNIYRFTFSNLQLCDGKNSKDILNCIDNYQNTVYYSFFKNKIEELKIWLKNDLKMDKNFVNNINIFVSVNNFDKLLSAIIFAKILRERLNIKPILVDDSTLFNSKYNTSYFERYFKDIIPSFILNKNINKLSTSYNAINFDSYISKYKVAPIRIMRECYYKKCNFCDRHNVDNFCFLTANICSKIKELAKLGVNNIVFEDDCLVPNQMCNLFKLLNEENIKIKWQGVFRFDSFLNDKNVIKTFADNGCKLLFFGLESFSQQHLNRLNKGTKVEDIISILKLCQKYKIKTSVSFLFGFPGETLEDLQITKTSLKKYLNLIDNCEFNFFVPTQNCKLDCSTNEANYFFEPHKIKEENKKLINEIMQIAKENNKTSSFYLKNIYCWEN